MVELIVLTLAFLFGLFFMCVTLAEKPQTSGTVAGAILAGSALIAWRVRS